MKLFTFTALAALFAAQVSARAVGPDGKYVVGYWSGTNASTIDYSMITHLNYAFSSIVAGVPSVPELLYTIVPAAHKAKTKVVLSIGGWGNGNYFTSTFNNTAGREKFVMGTKKVIDETGIDGIDFDWEYPGEQGACGQPYAPTDTANFLLLLKELRAAIGKDKLITAATATHAFVDETTLPSVNIAPFAEYFDYINLMSYDLNGIWGLTTGPHSPLIQGLGGSNKSVVEGVMAWNAAGMPLNKIVVGVPFYGHNMTSIESMANNTGTEEFNLVVGGNTGNNCLGGGFSTSITWDVIVTYLYPNLTTAIEPWIRKFDTISRSPWLTNSVTNMYISYEDPISLGERVDYVVCMDLLGVMTWQLALDNGMLLPVLNEISAKAMAKKELEKKYNIKASSTWGATQCVPTGPVTDVPLLVPVTAM